MILSVDALGQRHRQAGPFGDGGVVGEAVGDFAARRRCRPRIVRKDEALRRLRREKLGAVLGAADDAAVGGALDGVDDRHAGNTASASVERGDDAVDDGGWNDGRAPSWMSTRSGASSASASRPLSTETWRVAPPMTGGSIAAVAEVERAVERRVAVADDRQPHGRWRACRTKAAMDRARTGTPRRSAGIAWAASPSAAEPRAAAAPPRSDAAIVLPSFASHPAPERPGKASAAS